MKSSLKDIQNSLRQYASPERKINVERFFKTGKGQYGEGDEFIGVSNPDIRKVARQYKDISLDEIELLLHSPIHEDRLCALIILVNQNDKAYSEAQKQIVNLYIVNLAFINNWDLVDLSAHYILGKAIYDGIQEKAILDTLAHSPVLWERRVSIISTFYFIHKGNIDDTLRLSKVLLSDKEDLMHKAIGWALREAWKKDAPRVEEFLQENYLHLPRTTLRYAIERMEENKRKRFLKGVF
jgi:3-methyladenine DNA glycosylase AlkD